MLYNSYRFRTSEPRTQIGGENVNDENKRWRISLELTKGQEKALIEMRKQDENCRLSYGELLRRLIDAGLEKMNNDAD